MKKSNKGKGKVIRTAILLVLFVGILCFLCVPLFKNLKFGLDLQGGFEILYKVESIDGSKMTHDKIMATYKTLSKRIDSLGVTEPEIIIEGNDKIRVKLAGVTNPEEARQQLSTVATLSFRDADDNLLMSSDVLVSGGAKFPRSARMGGDTRCRTKTSTALRMILFIIRCLSRCRLLFIMGVKTPCTTTLWIPRNAPIGWPAVSACGRTGWNPLPGPPCSTTFLATTGAAKPTSSFSATTPVCAA